VGISFVFQQDNGPTHTSRMGKGYLTKESDGVLHQMTWLPQSPDHNPIEMVWDELDHRVKEKLPTTAQHMWTSFKIVGKAFLMKLVEKMSRVC
jgi:transposase